MKPRDIRDLVHFSDDQAHHETLLESERLWSEDVRLRVPGVGELAASLYRPVMRRLMSRGQQGLRRYVIATGPAR